MSTKWLDTAFRREKQNGANGKEGSTHAPEVRVPAEAAPRARMHVDEEIHDAAKSLGDLLPMEDVYRAAGILNPRFGYSINKVVEMINSDHMRGLSNDAKRAALMMALDAAGISMEEVLRDAAVRQKALDAYEAEQQRLFGEQWARKAEGNSLIQAELDRITAQYQERIKRNVDEVAAEKTALARWQAMKQLEAQRMSEAAGLCSKTDHSESVDHSLLALQGMGTSGKPS